MARIAGKLGKRTAALVVALALTTVGTAPAPRPATAAPETAVAAQQAAVAINDGSFAPTELRVTAGTTVTWTNQGRGAHTTTSQGNWDSGRLGSGQSWSRQFDTPGTFAYFCTIHPTSMRASVVVEGAPSQPVAPPPAQADPPAQAEPQTTQSALPPAPALAPPTTLYLDQPSGSGARGSNPAFGGVGSINPGLANVGAVAGPGAAAAQLAPQGGSGVTGEVSLLQLGATTTINVALSGLAPGSAHAGHIHQGACNGPILFPLEIITADASGQGRATAVVDAPLDLDTWWVQYHASDSPPGPPIACGQVAGG
jgi:plastocyanin